MWSSSVVGVHKWSNILYTIGGRLNCLMVLSPHYHKFPQDVNQLTQSPLQLMDSTCLWVIIRYLIHNNAVKVCHISNRVTAYSENDSLAIPYCLSRDPENLDKPMK